MALLRRLRDADDKAYASGSEAASTAPEAVPTAAPFNALGALEEMMGGSAASALPADVPAPDVAPPVKATQARAAPSDSESALDASPAALGSPAITAPAATAAMPELAVLLQQVGPFFHAALVHPGASAPPTEFAAAIRRMSETTAALTRQIVQASKEADEAWALERVQPAVARLVAEEWRIVAAHVPIADGRDAALAVAVSLDRLRPTVLAALDVRGLLQASGGEAAMPLEAVAVVARLCSEASIFSGRVEQFVPGFDVSPDLFLLNAVQFAQAETAGFTSRFPGASRDVASAFLVQALQAVALSFGRHSRGVLRAMAEAESTPRREAVEALIKGESFKSGFPTVEILADARVVVGRMAAMATHVLRAIAGERA